MVKLVEVPRSVFTWDSSNKFFSTADWSIPSGYILAGILVYPTNGGTICQGYMMNGNLRVVGWIPSHAEQWSSDYLFKCYLVCVKV